MVILEYVCHFVLNCIFVGVLYWLYVKYTNKVSIQTRFLWNLIRLTRSRSIKWEYQFTTPYNESSCYTTYVYLPNTETESTYIRIYENSPNYVLSIRFCTSLTDDSNNVCFQVTNRWGLMTWLIREINKSIDDVKKSYSSEERSLFCDFVKNMMRGSKHK